MSNYKIIELCNEPYDFLVIATSIISPLNCLTEIVKNTACKTARFIFDLTLIHGTNYNRYIKGNCTNGKFNICDFSIENSINENIKDISQSFFINNDDIVQNSILSDALKFLIRQGMI